MGKREEVLYSDNAKWYCAQWCDGEQVVQILVEIVLRRLYSSTIIRVLQFAYYYYY